MVQKNNAFDLLRILLSLSVLISHGLLIGGYGQDPLQVFSKGQTSFAETGVIGFFALSGFLISASFHRSPNILRFLLSRMLRLLPGFWVSLLITAFLLAPAIYYINYKNITHFNFLGANGSVSYVAQNCFLMVKQWSISYVLRDAVYKDSLNGSLWSLFPEFLCYLFTMVAGFFGLLNKNRLLLLGTTMLVFIYFVIDVVFKLHYGPTVLVLSNGFKLYFSFLCGMILFVFRDNMRLEPRGLIFLFLVMVILLRFGGYMAVAPPLIAVLTIHGFSMFVVKLKYDISYGLYIYAFPVEQLMSAAFGKSISFLLFITVCAVITCLLAFLSCILVEQPFLRLRRFLQRDSGADRRASGLAI